jgi:hypothetical protein
VIASPAEFALAGMYRVRSYQLVAAFNIDDILQRLPIQEALDIVSKD